MSNTSRISYFPITFFAVIMGLSGLTLAWRSATKHSDLGFSLEIPFAIITVGLFLAICIVYALKLIRHFDAVREEFSHPVKLSFFPAFSISLILISLVLHPYFENIALLVFWLGAGLQLIFTLLVMSAWVNHNHFKLQHMNPAWFIPIVGNIIVPIGGAALGQIQISWFFFSIGIVFWIVLMTIFFYRIIFHDPLPPKLAPTFFILIAPPAIGFVSYTHLQLELDAFAQILYGIALFLTLFLLVQLPKFARLPFALSWWAYSFPSAGITLASFMMAEKTGAMGYQLIAYGLFIALNALIVLLLWHTYKAIRAQGICLPE